MLERDTRTCPALPVPSREHSPGRAGCSPTGQGWVGPQGEPGWGRTPSNVALYRPKHNLLPHLSWKYQVFYSRKSFLEGFFSLQSSSISQPRTGISAFWLPDRKAAPAKETPSRSLQAAPAQHSPSTLPRAPAFLRPPQLGAGRN